MKQFASAGDDAARLGRRLDAAAEGADDASRVGRKVDQAAEASGEAAAAARKAEGTAAGASRIESRCPTRARGGVYLLRDPESGQIVRTGRTNDLARRQVEHARNAELGKYKFDVAYRTDSYAEQRGLEQLVHDQYQSSLNHINPISPTNPNRQGYLDAADAYLKRQNP